MTLSKSNLELSKNDTKMTKGFAIILMVLLHLFCKKGNVPWADIKIFEGGTVTLSYYIGLMGDCCAAIYCFCSGYALDIINQKILSAKEYYKGRFKALLKLLINYWIILIAFSIVGLLVGDKYVPGSIKDFVLNFFLIDNYTLAWWFLLTYVILTLISRPVYKFVEKVNPIFVCLISLVTYFVAYVQRIEAPIYFDIKPVDWALHQLALLGTSFMPFVWGMLFYKYKCFTKIKECLYSKTKNWQLVLISFIIVVLMTVAHGKYQSLIVAPFTGIVFILIFNVVKKGTVVDKIFSFFGEHSTNIWLVHMFFYSVIFRYFVYRAKYPILIFAFMLLLTVACSYIINLIYKPIVKLIK